MRASLYHLSCFALAALLPASLLMGKSLPPRLTAAIILRIIALESNLQEGSSIRIHVLDDDELYEFLLAQAGQKVGRATLEQVSRGEGELLRTANVVVTSDQGIMDKLLPRLPNRPLLLCSTQSKLEGVVAIAVFDDQGMPGILLDPERSRELGLLWKPEILKVAKVAR